MIYSLSVSRKLNWRRRYIVNIPSNSNKTKAKGRNTWVEDALWSRKFDIDSNSVTIINPLDKDPLSPKNNSDIAQYMHGGVSVTGDKLSMGLVYRVVDCEEAYCSSTQTLMIEHDIPKNYYSALYFFFDKDGFSSNLFCSYIQRFC